jgi:hypothetical protein
MNKQLHENHAVHLGDLKRSISIADGMLKQPDYLSAQQHETVSQGKAIAEMQFEYGLAAFKR